MTTPEQPSETALRDKEPDQLTRFTALPYFIFGTTPGMTGISYGACGDSAPMGGVS
ncbi:hypothetical protein AB0395_14650 [Streptosporangium sp. NPDC051023]|uniref:hypothetical protein n=1 Tax=Streptosporangium sp. NPDC051023 TaxID=3155410 RepID=UPI00344BDC69